MKVFVIPSWFPPNGGSFFLEQAQALNEVTEQVVLYVQPISLKRLFFNSLERRYLLKMFKINREKIRDLEIIKTYCLLVPKMERINTILQRFLYKRLFKYAEKYFGTPQLMHVHSSIWGGDFAKSIKKQKSIPYIITEHRSRFVDNKFARDANQLPENIKNYLCDIFDNASIIIPVSEAMNDKIKSYMSELRSVINIPNLVNEDYFFYSESNKERTFTYICVAGLIALKGIDTLLKAFYKLIQVEKDCQLIIVGDGEKRKELHDLALELDLLGKVQFLGSQSRDSVSEYMKKSHVFVLPTKYEAFGVVYIEALITGLPIVGTKRSGGPDYIIDKNNGLLVEIDNSEALAEAMQFIKNNYELYDKKKISLDAKGKYGKKAFQNAYLGVYSSVVGKDINP